MSQIKSYLLPAALVFGSSRGTATQDRFHAAGTVCTPLAVQLHQVPATATGGTTSAALGMRDDLTRRQPPA